ncbi:Bacteriophage replication protein GPA [compost metagenome]
MRTAFKDNDINVYGMRVVEPHHDGTPHWHMMLFCQPDHREQVIGIMRRYSLKEDGDERGAAKNRFECKHLNKGGRQVISQNTSRRISTVTRWMVNWIKTPASR